MICSATSWSSGRSRSIHSPSALAATAALASRGPIDAATSAGVVPARTPRLEPSGSVTVICSLMMSLSSARATADRVEATNAAVAVRRRFPAVSGRR